MWSWPLLRVPVTALSALYKTPLCSGLLHIPHKLYGLCTMMGWRPVPLLALLALTAQGVFCERGRRHHGFDRKLPKPSARGVLQPGCSYFDLLSPSMQARPSGKRERCYRESSASCSEQHVQLPAAQARRRRCPRHFQHCMAQLLARPALIASHVLYPVQLK